MGSGGSICGPAANRKEPGPRRRRGNRFHVMLRDSPAAERAESTAAVLHGSMRFESARFPQMKKECTYLCRDFPTRLEEDGGSAPMAPAHLQLGDADTTDHERAGNSIQQHQWMEQMSADRNRAKPQSAADGVEARRNHH